MAGKVRAARVRTGLRAAGAVGGVLGLVLSVGLAGPARAGDDGPSPLDGVPSSVRSTLVEGARACPDIPLAVQAAQLEVASGFATDARTPSGGHGIAGLTPTTWAVWGEDADSDGLRSAYDVADAIDAQARRMCWLYELARTSELRGDRLRLALAGYDVGWPKVVRAGGVPAAAQAYVEKVTAASFRRGRVAGTPFGDGWGVPVGFPLPIPNPRRSADAIAWAYRQVDGYAVWSQKCLNFTARAYGWDYSGTPYAIDHFWAVPASMRHHQDRNPPRGSLLFWDTGRRAGHVAISLGDGKIVSNDILTPGEIDVVPASLIERRWGARYLGWTAPYYPDGIIDDD